MTSNRISYKVKVLNAKKAQNEVGLFRFSCMSGLNRGGTTVFAVPNHILRAQLEDSESQKENYHIALIAAENRLERSQSATVRE